jgi:hypothetical protein
MLQCKYVRVPKVVVTSADTIGCRQIEILLVVNGTNCGEDVMSETSQSEAAMAIFPSFEEGINHFV